MPTPFVEEDEDVLENIVQVNMGATVKVTRMVLPAMVER